MNALYPSMLRLYYGVNANLKKDGILAPFAASVQNTKRLYELIGQPLDSIPTIHVGGTNGKGTSAFKISECLRLSGTKTGLFVSPHLASFRERIQVNKELISEHSFVDNLTILLDLCSKHSIPATEFELAFLMASMHFKQSECEAVVLEVGLGGEYDATNVVSTAVSVICSVSLDHTRILGSTLDAIARNKAGIFKKDRPALVGPDVQQSAVEDVARDKGAVLHSFEASRTRFTADGWIPGHLWKSPKPLTRAGQDSIVDTDDLNSDLSLLALCLLKEQCPLAFKHVDLGGAAVLAGLSLRPPCRWEQHVHRVTTVPSTGNRDGGSFCSGDQAVGLQETAVEVVLDMGHNPAAIAALCRRVKRDYSDKNVRVVYAMSRDKDVRSCLRTVLLAVDHDKIHFVQSDNFRAVSREDLQALFREETGGKEMTALSGNNIDETLREVMQLAAEDARRTGRGSAVVICGTGYIMPQARAFLGVQEPRDSVDLARQ